VGWLDEVHAATCGLFFRSETHNTTSFEPAFRKSCPTPELQDFVRRQNCRITVKCEKKFSRRDKGMKTAHWRLVYCTQRVDERQKRRSVSKNKGMILMHVMTKRIVKCHATEEILDRGQVILAVD